MHSTRVIVNEVCSFCTLQYIHVIHLCMRERKRITLVCAIPQSILSRMCPPVFLYSEFVTRKYCYPASISVMSERDYNSLVSSVATRLPLFYNLNLNFLEFAISFNWCAKVWFACALCDFRSGDDHVVY